MELVQTVKDFMRALENRGSSSDFSKFYHPEVVQIEYPNTLTKNTTTRMLKDLEAAASRGKQVLQKERYDIVNSYSSGNTVIIEAIYTGTLAIKAGKLKPGDEMKAYFAQFYEFKDGKIFRQRNYDCFEPFV
jgi:ketosteroid isomerase-like protein